MHAPVWLADCQVPGWWVDPTPELRASWRLDHCESGQLRVMGGMVGYVMHVI